MLGTKIYKRNFNSDLYSQCALWCNSNNATIEDKGNYYECVELAVHVRTLEETKQDLIQEVQSFMDATALERGYDNIMSACTYATSTVQKYREEGQACVQWRDAVWSYCYEQLALFEEGKREIPTDIISELPAINW